MAKQSRTRPVTAKQVRAYLGKAEEFLEAAVNELDGGRPIAASSLAIHAAINAADAVTGARTGQRAAGQDHDEVLRLIADAGKDGVEIHKDLVRLLPMKTKTEYLPDDIPLATARKAVERAKRCVGVARRVVGHDTR